jgi:hypothetical protein
MSYLGRSAKLSLKAQEKVSFLATAGQTSKTGLSYTVGFIEVYVNGVLLTDTTDFTATNGSSVTFTVALLLNDEVTVISLKTFTVADHYTQSASDARYYTQSVSDGRFKAIAAAEGGPSLGTNSVVRTNAKVIDENITFTGNENGSSVGPITVAAGRVILVASGSTWVVL